MLARRGNVVIPGYMMRGVSQRHHVSVSSTAFLGDTSASPGYWEESVSKKIRACHMHPNQQLGNPVIQRVLMIGVQNWSLRPVA